MQWDVVPMAELLRQLRLNIKKSCFRRGKECKRCKLDYNWIKCQLQGPTCNFDKFRIQIIKRSYFRGHYANTGKLSSTRLELHELTHTKARPGSSYMSEDDKAHDLDLVKERDSTTQIVLTRVVGHINE